MDEEILRKLDELVRMGRLTEEEKEEMLKEILNNEKEEASTKTIGGGYKGIFINVTREDLEIEGCDIDNIQIEKGVDTVDIEEKGEELKIVSKLKVKGVPRFSFSRLLATAPVLKIKIPKKINITIHTISGDVSVKGITGKLLIKSLSGDTKIEEVEGEIELDSISGDLNLTNVNGVISLHLKSGDITIRNCEVNGSLKTYSGDVYIYKTLIKGLKFNIFSGDIKMYDTLIKGDIKGRTLHGDMNLSIISDDLLISFETKIGDIRVLKDGIIEKISNKEIIVGEGRNKIELTSLNGDIKLSVKTHE